MRYARALSVILIFLPGCVTPPPAGGDRVVSDFCLNYVPVGDGACDVKTQARIDGNDAVWYALCYEDMSPTPSE